jgi:hypothetical protein
MKATFRSAQLINCHYNSVHTNKRDPKNDSSAATAENRCQCGKHRRLRSEGVINDQALTDKHLRMPVAKRLLAGAWLGRAKRMRSSGDVRRAEKACRRAVARILSIRKVTVSWH